MSCERWYYIDAKTRQLMKHSENDGPTFLRRGTEAFDEPVDIDQLDQHELRKALKDLVRNAR
jgi:hypothetical protein